MQVRVELKRAHSCQVRQGSGPPPLVRSISDGATLNKHQRPVDRRAFRSQLARLRARHFGLDQSTSSSACPVVFQQVESTLLSHALAHLRREAQQLQHHTLPDFPSRLAVWNAAEAQQWCQVSGCGKTEGVRAPLVKLELEIAALSKDIDDTDSQQENGMSNSAADLYQRLMEADKQLSIFDPAALARTVRQVHADLQETVTRLAQHLQQKLGLQAGLGTPSGECTKDEHAKTESEVGKALLLSAEQDQAVECPQSIFLQGRSGTGKTLVLIRRMIRMQTQSQQPPHIAKLKQLYVTKSSLLRNDVIAELGVLGCHCETLNWPPAPGVLCITWDQLVQVLDGSRAVIGYERFLQSYWPRICVYARQLSPLLIWTEFNTRLRPFGKSCGLSLQQYLKSDISATGIPLDRGDQHAIHWMFDLYSRMKTAVSEKDDVDVALELFDGIVSGKVNGKFAIDSLFVDEAQDFSPTELMMLFTLCKTSDSLTVAGDTCQTINPGSAFNFQDIADAFSAFWKRCDNSLRVDYKSMTLSFNYRCTPGVAALAGSVTSILLQRFPLCADRIEENTSCQQSGIPIFIQWPGQQPSMCIMGTGSHRMSNAAASQTVVLVRTDAQRQSLLHQRVQGAAT